MYANMLEYTHLLSIVHGRLLPVYIAEILSSDGHLLPKMGEEDYRRGYSISCRYFLKPGIANLSTPRDSSSTIPAATRRPRYFDA